MTSLVEVKKTEWYQTRPKLIQELIDRFPPTSSVRIKDTGQMAYVYSWSENNTLTLVVDPDAKENKHIRSAMTAIYQVFGCNPDGLEFLHENPPSVGLFLGKKMQAAAENQSICGECSQPKIPGYACRDNGPDCHGDACAYNSGLCCSCSPIIEG